MWLRQIIVRAFLALAAVVLGPIAIGPPADAQAAGKSSKLPAKTAQKSDLLSGRQDRFNPAKSDRQAQPAQSDEDPDSSDPPEPDIDPLDLLVPSDPHVEPDQLPGKPVKLKPPRRKPSRKAKSVRRPIDIAFKGGKLVINRFHTVKLDLPHKDCREFPAVITTDYKLKPGALETLADNMMIVQKRLCASNGSIMVTCYQNRATISLRKARPDDGCR